MANFFSALCSTIILSPALSPYLGWGTPSPLGDDFSKMMKWNIVQDHIRHTISPIILSGVQSTGTKY